MTQSDGKGMKNTGFRSHGMLLGIVAVLWLAIIPSCGKLGKKFTAFKVDSDPSDALVESLMESRISGGKFANAYLGRTPTRVKIVSFGFGAPFAGDTKIGIRVSKRGYKEKEIFFPPGNWHKTKEEARKQVKEFFVVLVPKHN